MKAILLIVVVFLASALASREQFEEFKTKYNKQYRSVMEEEYRFRVFEQSIRRADARNTPESLARFGMTKFSDLTQEEFKAKYLMKTLSLENLKPAPIWDFEHPVANVQALPNTFDWSTKGVVTAVKNQEQCGSCWAFSATECIESVYAIKQKTTVPILGPQQIVDCDTAGQDEGCNGGYPYGAFEYIISAGGQETESAYPYTAQDGTCQFNAADIDAKILNWQYVTQSSDEKAMQSYVYTTSPISVCVDAADVWQDYNGGVVTTNSGCGNSLDHAVQITGWMVQNNTNVWNVRNSWGADWGENGYIWLQMGGDVCGVADLVTAPTD